MTEPARQARPYDGAYFGGPRQRLEWPQVLLLLAAFALIHTFVILTAGWSLGAHQFVGTDTYSRMVRVQDLLASGNWFDSTYYRVNPPYGLVPHWSRPMDAVIAAEAILLSLFVEQTDALYWAGATISPILHLITLAVVVLGTKRLFGTTWAVFCGLIFILQPPLFQPFLAGRPDHNSLQFLMTAATIILTFRLSARPFEWLISYSTGALLAIDLWVGTETILIVVGVHAGLTVAWILWRRDFARKALHASLAALVVIVIALFFERSPQAIAAMPLEYDRLSVLQVVYFLIAAAFWSGLYSCEQLMRGTSEIATRIILSTIGAIAGMAMIYSVEPELFAGKLTTIDPIYARSRMAYIAESAPIYISGSLQTQGLWPVALRVFSKFGLALVGVIFLVYLVLAPRTPRREIWVFIAALLGANGAFAAFKHGIVLRDAPAVAFLLIFSYTELLGRIISKLATLNFRFVSIVRVTALSVMLIWPLMILIPVGEPGPPANAIGSEKPVTVTQACPITALAKYLAHTPPWNLAPRRIMTITELGPELLYRTQNSVFSIPNHRLQTGFTDTMRVMVAPDDGTARSVLDARGVDLLLICRSPSLHAFYRRGARALSYEGSMFRDRLLDGHVPRWLTPVEIPKSLAKTFLLIEMQHSPVESDETVRGAKH